MKKTFFDLSLVRNTATRSRHGFIIAVALTLFKIFRSLYNLLFNHHCGVEVTSSASGSCVRCSLFIFLTFLIPLSLFKTPRNNFLVFLLRGNPVIEVVLAMVLILLLTALYGKKMGREMMGDVYL
jgi:hypothetical protein